MADQILPAAPRHRLAVGHDFWARVAVFGLSEMLVAVGIRHLRGLVSAAGERKSGHAKAHGAPPSPSARVDARFNAGNAHDAYSVADKSRFRVLNADTHRGGKTFPNHRACCALLTLLRFEFANEFRPPRAETEAARQRRRLAQAMNSLSQTPLSRHIPPARSDAQSRRQRGQATTSKNRSGVRPVLHSVT